MIVTDVEYDAMDADRRETVKRIVITSQEPFSSIVEKYSHVRELDLRQYGVISFEDSVLLSGSFAEDMDYTMENPRKVLFHSEQHLKDSLAVGMTTVVCGTFEGAGLLLTDNVKCDTLVVHLDDHIQNVKAKTICFWFPPGRTVREFRIALDTWTSKCVNVEYDKLNVVIPSKWCYIPSCWRSYFVKQEKKPKRNVYELPWSHYVDDQDFHELFE